MDRKKIYELDKICRVCTSERREMRPLFCEKVAEMLMDCTSVRVEPIEGWPDKICVQCVHAVSRNHAFKTLVERSDKELREYIKSLTVQVVLDEPDMKNQQQQQQNKFNQQQKQHKLLEKQIKEQQQRIEEQQQKLREQEELLQQQQQQLTHPGMVMQPPPQQQQTKKLKPLAKKPIRPIKKSDEQPDQLEIQPLQQQQQQFLQQQSAAQLQQSQRSLQTQITTLASTHQQQQQVPQTLPPTTATMQPPPQLMPSTTAMPQQILLPNGQIITTTQIVTHPSPPQLTQIINTNPQPTVTATTAAVNTTPTLTAPQAQFLPQILQTPNGQTLQIVQQPNGTHTLQLVQLVPQRTIPNGLANTILADTDVQLIDEADVDDDLHEVYESMDGKVSQGIETIVLEDDLHHELMKDEELTHSDAQELEFFEDMESTPSQNHVDGEMPDQLLHNECDDEDEDDDFIIEEIQMDEEMLEEENDDANVIHVLDASAVGEYSGHEDCEYITDDNQPSSVHHLVSEADNVDDMDYSIMEAADDESEQHTQIIENVEHDIRQTPVIFNQSNNSSASLSSNTMNIVSETCNNTTGNPAKKSRRNNNSNDSKSAKATAASSRQLAATASSVIAAVGSDNSYEIDAKLVTDFIRQQTSPLGSGRYICNLCSSEFRQFKGLQNHMHSHANWIRANCKKQPQCQICLKSFKGPGMLRMHMKTHDAEAVAPTCNICNKTFKSKAILYRHRQTHQHRAYSCGVPNCRKTFSNGVNLRGHIERKHPGSSEGNYKCGECNSIFDDVDNLQTHIDFTGHGLADGNISMGIGNADTCDMSDIVAETTHTLTSSADTTVVMGTSGEVFFVTQA